VRWGIGFGVIYKEQDGATVAEKRHFWYHLQTAGFGNPAGATEYKISQPLHLCASAALR
jgi:hypothetical protein